MKTLLWQEHFTSEDWEAMENDPAYPWDKLLAFYKTAGNPEDPVIQSVIYKIQTFLTSRYEKIP